MAADGKSTRPDESSPLETIHSLIKIQFIMVMIHTSQLFFIKCNYPIFFAYWIFAYAIMFLLFFANFYVQAYKKKSTSSEPKIKTSINGYRKDE